MAEARKGDAAQDGGQGFCRRRLAVAVQYRENGRPKLFDYATARFEIMEHEVAGLVRERHHLLIFGIACVEQN